MPVTRIREFLQLESSSGILLMAAAVLALIASNSPLEPLYDSLLNTHVEIHVGWLEIAKPLLLWINDGLMVIFFLLIGLEVKREFLEGQFADPALISLPVVAAIGGMIVPALIYSGFNWGNGEAMSGWAIPTATDIAFALGVLSLLGSAVPASLKLFLMALAILDDLGAIVIIAIFYTGNLSISALAIAAVAVAILILLNRSGVWRLAPYIIVGIILWVAVLKSGVHATLAGVAIAFAIPMRNGDNGDSPLLRLEHALHPWVAFAILPLFAFTNAGISLAGLSLAALVEPVPLGIAAGLFIGKQLGVFGFAWLAIRLGLARLPEGAGWLPLYGVSILCGIGFTMSLFIATLAFSPAGPYSGVADRLGILSGSLLSALVGYGLLYYALNQRGTRESA